jgi:hypothetical protein
MNEIPSESRMRCKKSPVIACVLQISSVFILSQCLAQSTPSEFAEMSLQELFEQSIDETDHENDHTSPWKLAYQLKAAEFEYYLDGTQSLSVDDVLWSGPSEQRTAKNFPILPTTISQQAHIIALDYQFGRHWNGHLSIPFIKQKTDHISIVNDYDNFVIETDGLGDLVVSASYSWYNSTVSSWRLSFGLSLPTGSIDEVGDTPRAQGDQQLPYTMQLGSGTYDFPFELSYQNSEIDGFNVSLTANIRTGTNDRHYRLGNNYSLNGRYKIELSPTFQTFAGLAFQYSESINGQDDDLLVNGPFPYPAGITNPQFYGGKKINIRVGLITQLSDNLRLNIEFGKPIYQNLNGPQPKEQWRSSIYISKVM